MEPLKLKISKTHFQIRRSSKTPKTWKTPTHIAQPLDIPTNLRSRKLWSNWRISIKILRSQIEVDHVIVENSSNPNSKFLRTPLSLSLSYLVHIRVTPPLCKSLQLLSSTLKDLKHVLFFSFFLCINQVQNLSREKCAKVIDPECTEEVHFRVPTLWPMFRQVTVYMYLDTV